MPVCHHVILHGAVYTLPCGAAGVPAGPQGSLGEADMWPGPRTADFSRVGGDGSITDGP